MPITPTEAGQLKNLFTRIDLELVVKPEPCLIEGHTILTEHLNLVKTIYQSKGWGIRTKGKDLEFYVPSTGGTNYKD